jgi:hypothetical protein
MKRPVISLVLAAACMPAWPADAPTPALTKLVACTALQDAQQRLSCFDREIAPFARPVPVVPAPAPETTPPSLGEEQLAPRLRPADAAEEQVLHATVSSQRQTAPGIYAVMLDNGQIWRHEDDAQGSFLRDGDAVTLRKGSFGSYRLTRDAGKSRNWIRVVRIR